MKRYILDSIISHIISSKILSIFFRSIVPHLCSHIFALCFIAHSLFDHDKPLQAKPCNDVCPHLGVYNIVKAYIPQHRNMITNKSTSSPDNIFLGMNIPNTARGSYCLTTTDRPFCPSNVNKIGTSRCCNMAAFFNPEYLPIIT